MKCEYKGVVPRGRRRLMENKVVREGEMLSSYDEARDVFEIRPYAIFESTFTREGKQ